MNLRNRHLVECGVRRSSSFTVAIFYIDIEKILRTAKLISDETISYNVLMLSYDVKEKLRPMYDLI